MKPHTKRLHGSQLAQLSTRRDLNATNQRRDRRQLAKLDVIHTTLNALYDRARWSGDADLARHVRVLLDQVDEMRRLEGEDVDTHSTEAAIIDFDAGLAVNEARA